MDRKIAVAIPMLANVDPRVFASTLVGNSRWAKESNVDNVLLTPLRVTIEHGRNVCAEAAVTTGCEFIFFLDEDTEMDPYTISRLVDRMDQYPELIGIMPRYYIRGYPFELMAFRFNEDKHLECPTPEQEEEWPDEDGMLWCDAIGNSCSLIRTEVFKQIAGPKWFKTGDMHTEDIYFYMKIKHFLPEAKVAMDMTFTSRHQLGRGAVDANNVAMLRRRYEELEEEAKSLGDVDVEEYIFNKDPSLGRV